MTNTRSWKQHLIKLFTTTPKPDVRHQLTGGGCFSLCHNSVITVRNASQHFLQENDFPQDCFLPPPPVPRCCPTAAATRCPYTVPVTESVNQEEAELVFSFSQPQIVADAFGDM